MVYGICADHLSEAFHQAENEDRIFFTFKIFPELIINREIGIV
jgi:hypothetical protein